MSTTTVPFITVAPVREDQRLLLRAADLIERGGLAKHQRSCANPDGRVSYCIGGALLQAQYGTTYDTTWAPIGDRVDRWGVGPAWARLMAHLHIRDPQVIAEWNNRAERTQAEVVDALRDAAV